MKNKFFSTIKNYRWKSVFFRYLTSSFIIILAVLIPYNVIIFTYYNYFLSTEISNQAALDTFKSKQIFDLLTTGFNSNYNLARDTESVNTYIEEADPEKSHDLGRNTQDFVESLVSSTELVENIFIYSFRNNSYVDKWGVHPVFNKSDIPWLKAYNGTKLPFLMFPRKISSDTFNYLYVCSEIYGEDNSVTGVFCSSIKYSDFVDIVNQAFEVEPEKIFIVSNIGLILYSNDESMINTLMFEKPDIYKAFKSAKSTEGNSFVYEDYVISVAKSTSSQLILMAYANRGTFAQNYEFLINLIIFGTLCIFIVSVAIATFFSYRQYRSIVKVMQLLENPETLHQDEAVLSEFFYISNTIHNMSHKNEMMSTELSKKLVSLKRSQIQALQAQINPHFLFNTLQLINLSIIKEMKRDTAATELISQLSELMRACYDTENYSVTVAEEIQNAKRYIDIQKTRYKDRLKVFYDIQEDCLHATTLKLLLQPFIENAFVHGFPGQEGNWELHIGCRRDGNFIVFTISDNGTGITEDRLKVVQAKLKQQFSPTSVSIGISNVNQRLRLLYGSDYEISVISGENTTISIRHITN